jgi:hypothetical protein
MPAPNPLINGNRHDYSSIEFRLGGGPRTFGVVEISYSHTLEPTAVRGTSAKKIGRTRGQYDAEGSFTVFKTEADEIIAELGDGYLERSFNILVSYAEPGLPVVSDVLVGCRIKRDEDQHSEGGEPLRVKFDLDVMEIRRSGRRPLNT